MNYNDFRLKRYDFTAESPNNVPSLKSILSQNLWEFASENVDDDFHTDVVFLKVACSSIAKELGDSHDAALILYREYCGEFYFDKSNTARLCKKIIDKSLTDPSFRKNFNKKIYTAADALSNVFEGLNICDLSRFSNEELKTLYKTQFECQIDLYRKCWIAEILQVPNCGMENYLMEYLKTIEPRQDRRKKFFHSLCRSSTDSVYVEEELEVIAISKKILSTRDVLCNFDKPLKYLRTHIPPWLWFRINNLRNTYGFLYYHGFGDRDIPSVKDYLSRIKDYVSHPHKLYQWEHEYRCGKEACVIFEPRTKKIDKIHMELFHMYSDMAISKAYRRLAQLKNFYYLDELLQIISIRFNILESTLRFMMPCEILSLFNGELSSDYLSRCSTRSSQMAFMIKKDSIISLENISPDAIRGIIFPKNTSSNFQKKQFHGRTACGGITRGRAVLIERTSESSHFRPGDIIVSIEADPDLIPLMKKAGAIVTDQGGITCHAAVIAREFNIPCIIGTGDATKWVKTGDSLFINASEGTVSIIEKS